MLQNGTGVLTLTGTGTWVDGTIVSNGVLQVGNGGTTGSIGTGNVKLMTTIVFDRSDSLTFGGAFTFAGTAAGGGSVVQGGSGTLTLSGALTLNNIVTDGATFTNVYYGSLTASNGTLAVSGGSVNGNVNVSGGILSPSAIGTIGTLAVTNTTMTISSGGVLVTVNKLLAPSNSVFLATNVVATGGTVKLANYGSAFKAGDRFVIFKQPDGVTPLPVTGGDSMTVSAPGVTSFVNNLKTDGSVTVQTITATPLAFTSAVTSGSI